ncbi:MAG: polyphenol oxidase [Rhodospirillaceae bacterium TMED8]|nr:polyphenol oxidase [Magnetovibrio sp.]OUT47717.1 MAG: polyphenol oxidase [Rhodospirillaceae bacterium TMED8]|tara:strand:+ start:2141 stop:2917 length:777 start_codon:yes stop_codon:yes gene_type:complete
MIYSDFFQSLPRIRHGFLTREGGVSKGLFASLNCGFGSGDATDYVRENRHRAAAKIGLEAHNLASVYQVHSADVVEVKSCYTLIDPPKADAMVTRQPGIALGILTADCVPILFADTEAGIIGAAHAGWRGALSGVVQGTVGAMERLGSARANIHAVIGPCIRQSSYEVGVELRQAFIVDQVDNDQFFVSSVQQDRFMFDLAGYVRGCAESSGIKIVVDVARDTYSEEDLFFSYRRATHKKESGYGRGISLISLEISGE